jgi:hypothetical protein
MRAGFYFFAHIAVRNGLPGIEMPLLHPELGSGRLALEDISRGFSSVHSMELTGVFYA